MVMSLPQPPPHRLHSLFRPACIAMFGRSSAKLAWQASRQALGQPAGADSLVFAHTANALNLLASNA